ncbi:MAG: hypothetical protein ACYCVB_10815 [Bacilli bacterium]
MQMGGAIQQPLIATFYRVLFEVTGAAIAVVMIIVFARLTKYFMRWENGASPAMPFPDRDDGMDGGARDKHGRGGRDAGSSLPPALLARLVLRRGVAILWILDAALQAQPLMVTGAFVSGVLRMAQQNQPSWLYHLMEQGILVWIHYPIAANIVAIYVQAGVGIAMLWADSDALLGKTVLWVSVLWAFFIWVFGEGLGGMLTGAPTNLTGSPGSALFYAGAAILLLLPKQSWLSGQVAWLSRIGLGVYWIISAVWQASPGAAFHSPGNLVPFFSIAAAMPQPAWLAAPIHAVAALAVGHAFLLNAVFVCVMAAIGIGMIMNRFRTWVVLTAGLWLLFSWWTSMDFGVMGGLGTDPNSPPIVALLMVAAWFMTPASRASDGPLRASGDS